MAYGWQPVIVSTATASALHGVKCCVYGRAGVGKTVLCATAPSPFIISAEKGLLSLSRVNLPAVEITSIQELRQIGDWVTQSFEARQFATFCLDSITEIAEKVLATEKARNRDPRKAYGETQDQILVEFRRFRDLAGPNVYFTAKQDIQKDPMGGGVARPWMPGQQLPQAMPYFFDEVFQLNVAKDANGQQFRYLRAWPDAYNEAKDRSGKLDEFEPPDLAKVFYKILH
jgi:hypothetical protein